jgi:hypothetical protein
VKGLDDNISGLVSRKLNLKEAAFEVKGATICVALFKTPGVTDTVRMTGGEFGYTREMEVDR